MHTLGVHLICYAHMAIISIQNKIDKKGLIEHFEAAQGPGEVW